MRWLTTFGLIWALTATGYAAEPLTTARHHVSQSLGIEFDYPTTFTLGRFEATPLPPSAVRAGVKSPFVDAVVLAEPAQLRGQAASAIHVGEIPTIAIEIQSGQEAEFTRKYALKQNFETTLGGRKVFKLPGFPGPYGDQAFYYVVPLAGDRLARIVAHRYYFRDPRPESSTTHAATGYDRVIEQVIIPRLRDVGAR